MIYHNLLHKALVATTTAAILAALPGCTSAPARDADQPIIELNTDRPGSDISTITLDKPQPKLCSDSCRYNERCAAWTYVKPGVIDAKAHCRIKHEITAPTRSSCCISGVKKDRPE